MRTRRVVTGVHKKTVFVIVGGLVAVGLAAAVIVGLVAPSPAAAYKGNGTVQIKTATLQRHANGTCSITVTWDKNAGRPKYYMLERESPPVLVPGGALPGALSIDAPQKLSPAHIRAGSLTIGPLPSADIAHYKVSMAGSLHGKKAVWVASENLIVED